MKRIMQTRSLALVLIWLTASVTRVHGQDTIVYFNGPPLPFQYEPGEPGDAALDLNLDGTPDLSFQLGYFICTADVPASACSGPFYVSALETSAILGQRFNQAAVLPFGSFIGSAPPTNSTWSNTNQSGTVATYFFSPRHGTRGLFGPLAEVGVGYLGVRFHAADGPHYGWVRIRSAPSVAVVDWAYESRPHIPIHAGIISANGESLQFTVNFQSPNDLRLVRTATFILTGNVLRGELALAGLFSSAHIVRDAPTRAKVKRMADLGQPVVSRTDFTSFFGDVTLSRSEIIQLLQGRHYICMDNGAILGQIEPLHKH